MAKTAPVSPPNNVQMEKLYGVLPAGVDLPATEAFEIPGRINFMVVNPSLRWQIQNQSTAPNFLRTGLVLLQLGFDGQGKRLLSGCGQKLRQGLG